MRDTWSDSVDDLCGRLRIQWDDVGAGLRLALHLEVLNRSSHPRAVTNQPQIRAAVFDSAGNMLQPAGAASSGPDLPAQWAVIPRDAYIGFRIDHHALGIPTKAQRQALVALGGRSWKLGVGTYVLKVAAVFGRSPGGPDNQWGGELTLLPTEFAVTERSFGAS